MFHHVNIAIYGAKISTLLQNVAFLCASSEHESRFIFSAPFFANALKASWPNSICYSTYSGSNTGLIRFRLASYDVLLARHLHSPQGMLPDLAAFYRSLHPENNSAITAAVIYSNN